MKLVTTCAFDGDGCNVRFDYRIDTKYFAGFGEASAGRALAPCLFSAWAQYHRCL